MTTDTTKSSIIIQKLELLPVGVFATTLGFITLGNCFTSFGINSVRHVIVNLAVIILIIGFMKLFIYPSKVKEELKQTIGASIYPTFPMSMMLMGAYYAKYYFPLGKGLWLLGILIHLLILICFIYFNIIKTFNFKEFLPSTFVPFVGLIVATISGGAMNSPMISTSIFYFSFIAYFIMLPFLVYRLFKHDVNDKVYPIVCIMAAPPSLCVVAYTTLFKEPNLYITLFVYAIVVIMSIYMYTKFPKIFRLKFMPSHAGITFPLAITTLATIKVSGVLALYGYEWWSVLLKEIAGLQIVLACAGITFVAYSFMRMFFDIFKAEQPQ